MSARREPSSPPSIPGYEHSRLLGMGGFADVFLYQQQMPRRSVAVKVLLASALGDEVRERFRHEADVMAQLSHHPSIVTIYHADVAPDGRPFLVMEYCARPGLGERYRSERMAVAEVLRIGVRLASAVETAHRAGVLHRDIKPANVLLTDFGWPALTDFGIAATTGGGSGSAVGMSIPWTPPELLAENPTGDARADVYSLAATIYSLLARRSPFEVPDGANTAADLISRIERAAPTPTGRGDVPDSLQAVLVRAMDRSPGRRHHSALAFARALQQVEAEMMLPLTPLDLPEDVVEQVAAASSDVPPGAADDRGEHSQATRLRPVQSISPVERDGAGRGAEVAPGAAVAPDGIPVAWRRPAPTPGSSSAGPDAPGPRRGARRLAGAVAGLVVVAAVGTAAVLTLTGEDPAPQVDAGPTATPTPLVLAVPAPTDLEGAPTGDGTVAFAWENPEPQEGDRYLWGVVVPGEEPERTVVEEPTVTVAPVAPGEPVCVEVSIVRSDGRYSTRPAAGCAQP